MDADTRNRQPDQGDSNDGSSDLPVPGRMLWRTYLRWPRNVTRFAPPIPMREELARKPPLEEVAHWGEYGLLEDLLTVLHRDGTPTYRRRWVYMVHGVKQIERWERFEYRFDKRTWKYTLPRASLILPGGEVRRARVVKRTVDSRGGGQALAVSFAGMAPGSVVDIEDQQDNFVPYYGCSGIWGNSALQTASPCRRRRFTFAVAMPFTGRFTLHNGAAAPLERWIGEYRVWTWEQRDVPGIAWDQWTPPLFDIAPWVDFTTLPGWRPVADHYYHDMKIRRDRDVTDLAARLRVGTLSDRGDSELWDIKAAYNYTARDVRYGRPHEKSHDFAVQPLAAVAGELRGDCKDKSALLVALLRELKVEARVVLVHSTRWGHVAFLPGARFDHALVCAKMNGRELWLDPTNPYTFGQLPSYDQGVQGLVMDRRNPNIVSLPHAQSSDHGLERVVEGRLNDDDSFVAKAHVVARGDQAARWRQDLIERDRQTRDRVLQQYAGGLSLLSQISDLVVEYLDDLSGDLTISHRVRIPRMVRRIQNLMLVRIPWLEPIRGTGFFAAESRSQPLAAPIHSVTDRLEIELPDGLSGYALPWECEEQCDWGRYRCSINMDNGKLICKRHFEYIGGVIRPDQFPDIKRFTEACIHADANDVVLMAKGKGGELDQHLPR